MSQVDSGTMGSADTAAQQDRAASELAAEAATGKHAPVLPGRPRRVAVVGVHGVGDPGAGATCAALQRLLLSLNKRTGGPTYADFRDGQLSIAVRPMASQSQAKPRAEDIKFTWEMIRQLKDEGPSATYETCVASSRRNNQTEVHVYELYWADLVRLGQGFRRTLSGIYQIILHAPEVGQRDLDIACENSAEWKRFQLWHEVAVSCLTVPIALVNLWLLPLVPIAPILKLDPAIQTYFGIAIAILVCAVCVVAHAAIDPQRKWGPGIWSVFLISVAVSVLEILKACGVAIVGGDYDRIVAAASLISCGLVVVLVIKAYDTVRAGVSRWGWWIGVCFAILTLPAVFVCSTKACLLGWMFVIACILWVALVLSWLSLFLCNLCALVENIRRCRLKMFRDLDPGSCMARTARITLALGTVMFFLVSQFGWDLLVSSLRRYGMDQSIVLPSMVGRALFALKTLESPKFSSADAIQYFDAAHLLLLPFHGGVIAACFVAALSIAIAVFALLPSVLTDVRFPANPRSQKFACALGVWLSRGLEWLPAAGEILFIAALSITPAAIGFCFLPHDVTGVFVPLGVGFGIMSAFLVGGGHIDAIYEKIGPILTAILDIDAYMRLRPFDNSPRGRIFTRYVALLRSLCDRNLVNYDEIILVAHSQGTVITADLLRYLNAYRDKSLERLFPITSCEQEPANIRLTVVTAGSPLRQLYLQRFPYLYGWVRDFDRRSMGVGRWVSVFRTGDYIGRWLGSPPDLGTIPIVPDEWTQVYHFPAQSKVHGTSPEEVCFGAGAHVHYFDEHAPAMAYIIDELIG